MIKFSILVPVYNVSKYLKQCIDSIINQTYSELEIICIDDGSTDESGEMLDAYAAKDSRIHVIHKANSGYGSSMNRGLQLATGDYIGIVESDDYIAPNMYARFAEVIENAQGALDVVKAMYFQFTRQAVEKRVLFESEMCNKIITAKEYPNLFSIPCSIWSGVYRKDFLKENDIYFLETPGASYQDTSFYFKTMLCAQKLFLLEDALLYYRTDNEGSSINSGSKLFHVCGEMREIESYIEKKGIVDIYWKGVLGAFIFRAYLWNYYRVHTGLRAAFWSEMIKAFEQIMHSPAFKQEYWPVEAWERIHAIMADPERFFWDSSKGLRTYNLEQLTSRSDIYEEMLPLYLQKQAQIIIYGAGVWAKRIWEYIKKQGWQQKVIGFAVTNSEEQVEFVEGKKVYEIQELIEYRKQALMIVAVAERSQPIILKLLSAKGFSKVIRMDEALIRLVRK